jgi:hypothetical protein
VFVTEDSAQAEHRRRQGACETVWLLRPGMARPRYVLYLAPEACACRAGAATPCRDDVVCVAWGEDTPRFSPPPEGTAEAALELLGPGPEWVLDSRLKTFLPSLCEPSRALPRFRPCEGPLVLIDAATGSSGLLLPRGEFRPLTQRVRLPGFNGLYAARSTALILPALPVSAPWPVDRAARNTLFVAAPAEAGPGALRDLRSTVLHEGFHLFFQQLPIMELSGLLGDGLELHERPDMGRLRPDLSARYARDAAFRSAVGLELCALEEGTRRRSGGDLAGGRAELIRALALRAQRHTSMSATERLAEAYWEYVEGTAQFVEEGESGAAVPGFRDCRAPLSEDYFLVTGSTLTWALAVDGHGVLDRLLRAGALSDLARELQRSLE